MTADEWEELDLKAMSTIQLCLADEVMYNVTDVDTSVDYVDGPVRVLEKARTQSTLEGRKPVGRFPGFTSRSNQQTSDFREPKRKLQDPYGDKCALGSKAPAL